MMRFRVVKTTKLVATCDCPEGADSFEVGKCQQLFADALKKSGISGYTMRVETVHCGSLDYKRLTAYKETLSIEEF